MTKNMKECIECYDKKKQQHNKTYTEGDMRVQPHSAAMLWHIFTDGDHIAYI